MIKNLQLCNIDCLHGTISVVNNFKDFQEVFKVFMSEPFFEAWTENDMKEEFEDIKSHGEILGYYTNFDIAGLLTLIDGAKESHPVKFENPEKVIYISDVATKKEYRGKGYAKDLVNYFMHFLDNQDYYDRAYLRTNLEGSMSEGLFIPYGFETIRDENNQIITQTCEFPRVKPELPETDVRKFLVKKLK